MSIYTGEIGISLDMRNIDCHFYQLFLSTNYARSTAEANVFIRAFPSVHSPLPSSGPSLIEDPHQEGPTRKEWSGSRAQRLSFWREGPSSKEGSSLYYPVMSMGGSLVQIEIILQRSKLVHQPYERKQMAIICKMRFTRIWQCTVISNIN